MNRDNYTSPYNGRGSASDRNTTSGRSAASGRDLLKKLQAIGFAKVETELYLDAHPECAAALEHYEMLVREYSELLERYESSVAPITHEGSVGDGWEWVKNPWPWHNEEV